MFPDQIVFFLGPFLSGLVRERPFRRLEEVAGTGGRDTGKLVEKRFFINFECSDCNWCDEDAGLVLLAVGPCLRAR